MSPSKVKASAPGGHSAPTYRFIPCHGHRVSRQVRSGQVRSGELTDGAGGLSGVPGQHLDPGAGRL